MNSVEKQKKTNGVCQRQGKFSSEDKKPQCSTQGCNALSIPECSLLLEDVSANQIVKTQRIASTVCKKLLILLFAVFVGTASSRFDSINFVSRKWI